MFQNIVLITGEGATAGAFYHALPHISTVIMEGRQSKKTLLQGRIRKLGGWTVFGQLLFQVLVAPALKRLSRTRIAELRDDYGLSRQPIPVSKLKRVSSVNASETARLLQELQPDLILIHGTRIVARSILGCVACPWVNIHAGITPHYRGGHGAYWALYHRDPEHCGVTVHLVDPGIDTGQILAQGIIRPSARDNFATYPFHQLGVGLGLLRTVLDDWPQPAPASGPSALYHHPTLWQYLSGRLRGIR